MIHVEFVVTFRPYYVVVAKKKQAAVEGKNLKAFGLRHYPKTSSTKHLKAAFHWMIIMKILTLSATHIYHFVFVNYATILLEDQLLYHANIVFALVA